jgi:putative tryptophan/tyrosine transport system substrate-binding protein
MIQRRDFITLLGGAAAAWPAAAWAQQRPAMQVVGLLSLGSAAVAIGTNAFRRGLEESGYVEGRNVAIEYRYADGQTERLPAMAADLVQRRVTVLVAGPRADLFAKNATNTIPIVFLSGSDPVQLALVTSLNRPGGNATGIANLAAELEPKRLGLLREINRQIDTITVLLDQNRQDRESVEETYESAARKAGVSIHMVRVAEEGQFEATFAKIAREGTKTLAVSSSSFFNIHRNRLVALSARYAIPTMYELREYVEAGGLMSYGSSVIDSWRKVGAYTGRILKGEKPADLPVQLPTKFDFVLNLKTAKVLSLDIPPGVLAIVDEVIE